MSLVRAARTNKIFLPDSSSHGTSRFACQQEAGSRSLEFHASTFSVRHSPFGAMNPVQTKSHKIILVFHIPTFAADIRIRLANRSLNFSMGKYT